MAYWKSWRYSVYFWESLLLSPRSIIHEELINWFLCVILHCFHMDINTLLTLLSIKPHLLLYLCLVDLAPFNEKSIPFPLLCTANFLINEVSICACICFPILFCPFVLFFHSCLLICYRFRISFGIWESKSPIFVLVQNDFAILALCICI